MTSSLKGATGATGLALLGATKIASAFPNTYVTYESTTETLTVEQLLPNRIIVTTQTVAITLTMPTAPATLTAITGETATTTFEFTIVNNCIGIVTLATCTGFTTVGNTTVTASSATTDGSGSWMCVVSVNDVSAACYRE